jgi:hypothetical protein
MAHMNKALPSMGKLAALKVKEQIANGERPNLYRASLAVGYTESSARAGKARQTKSYKDEMMDVTKAMENEREQCFKELAYKNVRKTASYRDRIEAINKLTSNIQLLTGKKTSNDNVSFSWEEDTEENGSEK